MLSKKNLLKTLFSLMSIVSKMLLCSVCYRWMAHLELIVVYIEFAWNYAHFNSNDYYFMKTTHLLKPQSYARKLQNHSSVRTMAIPGWILCWWHYNRSQKVHLGKMATWVAAAIMATKEISSNHRHIQELTWDILTMGSGSGSPMIGCLCLHPSILL